MGARIASRLESANLLHAVWNRSPGRMAPFAERDIACAASPAALANACDVVLLSLCDAPSVRDVLGPPEGNGILHGAREGLVVLDTTTLAPDDSRAHAERCAARGVAYLDCPVAGSIEAADAGRLAVLAGGDEDALARAAPALDTFADRVLRLGSSGAGSAAKALVNAQLAINLAALAEMGSAATAMGLHPAKALEALSLAGANPLAATRGRDVLAGGGVLRFPAAYLLKDLGFFEHGAEHVPTPLISVARAAFEHAVAHGGVGADATSVALAYAQQPQRAGVASASGAPTVGGGARVLKR